MLTGGMTVERGDEFTLREWEQAWAHTRHLETMRGQYLGFFFTAVLGVTALAGPRLADDSLRTSGDLLTVAVLALALELLTGFLYLSVVRMNNVLGFYSKQIETISQWMLSNGAVLDLTSFITAAPPSRKWAGTSGTSQIVLQCGIFGLPFVSAGIFARSVDVIGFSVVSFCCGLALLASCCVVAGVFLAGAPPGEED